MALASHVAQSGKRQERVRSSPQRSVRQSAASNRMTSLISAQSTRIQRLRRQLREGRYDVERRLDIVLDRLIDQFA